MTMTKTMTKTKTMTITLTKTMTITLTLTQALRSYIVIQNSYFIYPFLTCTFCVAARCALRYSTASITLSAKVWK